ncbi:phosphatase [Levilactobacillus bambusae]|uniref:Phosphatase n=2 Tax=Levilactobacillus bambusae TaxID=2024736 RepID=A0A2V1N0N4_9LACO|nr:phosphatase [Levilactobacillus bambusae]
MINRDADRPWRFWLVAVLFVILAVSVKMQTGFLNFLDSTFISMVQKNPSNMKAGFYAFMTSIASPTLDIIWVVLIAFLLWGFKYKIQAIWAILTIIGGDAVAAIVKKIIARPRPSMHLKVDDGYSFPSGHVFGAFLVIAILWVIVVPMIQTSWKRIVIQVLMVIVLILIMASRIYRDAHYPSDTLGSVMLAYMWLQIAEGLYARFAPRLVNFRVLHNSKL